MRPLRVLLLAATLLLSAVAFAAPAQAAPSCTDVQVCPIVIADAERVCAGLLLGSQGNGVCVWTDGCIGYGGAFTNYRHCYGLLA